MTTFTEITRRKINSILSLVNGSSLQEDNIICNTIMLTQNAKINRIIEEINIKYTRKQIAILLLEIAEKPEICVDFNISLPYYLHKYLSCQEDICLSEAGVFILCAAKIYSRRIDNIFDGIQRMLAGIEKTSKEIEQQSIEKNKEKVCPKPSRRPPKRSLPKDNALYEYEIEPKIIKKGLEEKIWDKKSTVHTFDPPTNYFQNFKKYLEYRNNKKKVKKDDSKYNEYVDPSLYKYSTIEDFDYEDDIDSKRNYKTLHGHIEHRYSTIVSDINFLMHFKVKDFIEEELEEIEKQLSLGVPQIPKRKWYSLCNNEYRNGLLEVENEVLEREFDTPVKVPNKRRRISGSNYNFDNNESNINKNKLDGNTDKQDPRSNDGLNNIDKNAIESQDINKSKELLPLNELSANKELLQLSSSLMKETEELNVNQANNAKNESSIDKNLVQKESVNVKETETIDPKKIIVRLTSEDDGIFLSDLDDIQSAMLSPKVIAIDIRKSIDKKLDYFSISLDKTLENFLGLEEKEEEPCCPINILDINEEIISYKDNFSLPFEFLIKKIPIVLNIFKFPDKKIRISKAFSLPDEYNLYKADRCKKKLSIEKPPRMFKPNTPPVRCGSALSLIEQPDLIGFSHSEINGNMFIENMDLDRQRTISTDSGIVDSKSTSFNVNTTKTEDDINIENNILSSTLIYNQSKIDSGFFSSTETDAQISKFSENELTTGEMSAKVIDVQIIKPPRNHTEETNKDSSTTCHNEHYEEVFGSAIEDNIIDENDNCLENIKAAENIKLWHKTLKPILAKSKDRHHFDVFNLGTEIMNKLSIQHNNTINFRNVMEEKDPSYTSRYFLSMLLLANTNNIKLNVKNKSLEQPTSPENIDIVLLSTKRHTVSVEDNIGIIHKKNKAGEMQSTAPFFPKVIKISKSIGNDDNDSGFFSNTSAISSHDILR